MIRLAIYLILLVCCTNMYAQPTPDDNGTGQTGGSIFTNEAWEEATKGIDYSSDNTENRDNMDEDVGNEPGGLTSISKWDRGKLDGSAGKLFAGIVKVVFVIMVSTIVVLLLWSVLRGEHIFKKQEQVKTDFDIAKIEENLEVSDLEKFIAEAENNQNYPLAVRLYYLAIIKTLSRQKIIRYKKNKTNMAYMLKVDETAFGTRFRAATDAFERIWYGQAELTKADYERIKTDFRQWNRDAKALAAIPTTNTIT